MSKTKKKKVGHFDNSISIINTTCVINCPDCEDKLLFMYTRKRTEDELFLCRKCQTIYQAKIEFKIIITKHKKL